MEFGDVLIWGGLTIIVLRYLIPRLLDWLGVEVTKTPKSGRDGED
ncbi:MAG: hypothetical protein ACON4P_07045 [Candidatus Puniceispirillales bacterium]